MMDVAERPSVLFIVTRPAEQGERSFQFLLARGAAAVQRPLIVITSLPMPLISIERLRSLLASPDTLYVCTSVQSVRQVRSILGEDVKPQCRVLAQGPRTAAAWSHAFGTPPDHVFEDSRATAIAPFVAAKMTDSTVLLVTGPKDRLSPVATAIGELGIPVERIPLYQTSLVPFTHEELLGWKDIPLVAVLLYSPSAVAAVCRSPLEGRRRFTYCCFGSTTADAAKQGGLPVLVSSVAGDDESFLLAAIECAKSTQVPL